MRQPLIRRLSTVITVMHTIGWLLIVLGILLLLPLVVALIYSEYYEFKIFLIPAAVSVLVGLLLVKFLKPGRLYFLQSMLVCGMAWVVLSLFACLPFHLGGYASMLDAYFETVSGFTTTGITIFTHIGKLSRSVIFWRSFIQWQGGLGILTLFLAITFVSNNAYYQLFGAEAHKIDSARPTPSIYKTVLILWGIYIGLTLLETTLLKALGVGLFDAVNHSLTTLSTGGFSPHDASIDYFRQNSRLYPNYKAIEYVITFFMFAGGINFLVHYMVLTRRLSEVTGNTELRYFIIFIVLATALILADHYHAAVRFTTADFESDFRRTLFTVVSIITTTGYSTVDINTAFFPVMSRQIILALMLIGGCIGSTAGGIKVLRVTVLFKLFIYQVRRLRLPQKALAEVVIDHRVFPFDEIKRVTGLFLGWLLLLFIGGMITAFFTNLSAVESFSGMFSALGNVGPCFFSVKTMSELPAIVKLTYIFGMLAGRLEILPILLIFSWQAWRH